MQPDSGGAPSGGPTAPQLSDAVPDGVQNLLDGVFGAIGGAAGAVGNVASDLAGAIGETLSGGGGEAVTFAPEMVDVLGVVA